MSQGPKAWVGILWDSVAGLDSPLFLEKSFQSSGSAEFPLLD